MKFINLTLHDLYIREFGGEYFDIPQSGEVAKVEVIQVLDNATDKIGFYRVVYGPVTGLPDPEDGVIYIVSENVERAAKRDDVWVVGDVLIDQFNQPIGRKGLKKSY